MAIFKCKMCGGALELCGNESVVTCEYCGTQQTLPKLNDERKTNLYDRANHFRRSNEFDKAMGIYEQILNEDNTDAESYWSLVLCRYGIEYVEDPQTHKRVPTVNRAQFTSVFDDDNYKAALQYADAVQRGIYEEEAKAINEIQKGILAISQKEEPFDVFICYKETDQNGRRTPDSVWANDLYHQLTQEGFKVFFSRITLEDKLGSAYEPYIFAALNSAKVMVVLGTKPEYFKAVWVRNEWSRYLGLIKQGQQKMLIPAYKDMDPYDLPEEFSHLQAQDMSKLGFMQDLIRGIKKIARADEPQVTVVKETVVAGGNANIAPLLKRAFIFLEDKDWKSADEYCEKVLDLDPENAEAYLGKLMASLRVSKKENFTNCGNSFRNDANYQKVCRYGDKELIAELEKYNQQIDARNEERRLQQAYEQAADWMRNANSEADYKKAAQAFERIGEYKDAKEKVKECLGKAEEERKDSDLSYATKTIADGTDIRNLEIAIRALQLISGWKNADELVVEAKKKIEEIKERERQAEIARKEAERKAKEDRKERARKAEEERKERERLAAETAKRNKKIAMIVTPIVCIVIGVIIFVNTVVVPKNKYNDAMALMEAGKYQEAITAFEELGDYKDSVGKINECHEGISNTQYEEAIALMEVGKYQEAIAAFEKLGDYKDCAGKINECYEGISNVQYEEAIALMEAGKYQEAIAVFEELGEYKDSAEKKSKCKYEVIKGNYEEIKEAKVGDYVIFGSYEQDGNTSNGAEGVEWLVLEVKAGKALLLSKYGLDEQKYNGEMETVTWETCSLRKWLNNIFLDTVFSENEKALVPTVTVTADRNPNHSTNPGNSTRDQIFLLSITEVNQYFSSDTERICEATVNAKNHGARVSGNGNSEWWLRSPGSFDEFAAYVRTSGSVNDSGLNVDGNAFVVRPALWIDLNSDIF